MNQTQRKYAAERLQGLYNTRRAALVALHTTPAVKLTPEQRLAALKKGKVKINPEVTRIDAYPSATNLFIFTEEKKEVVNTKKLEAEINALDAEFLAANDELMLGDEKLALQLIKDFDK